VFLLYRLPTPSVPPLYCLKAVLHYLLSVLVMPYGTIPSRTGDGPRTPHVHLIGKF